MKLESPRALNLLLLLCSILLGLGLFGPAMLVEPGYGKLNTAVALLSPQLKNPYEFSIVTGIRSLFADGHYVIASVVFLFSVVFPIWKLGVIWAALDRIRSGLPAHPLLGTIERWGKFSMLDIFVIAVIVVAFKGLPGDATVSIRWGLYAFSGSILLSLKMPHYLWKLNRGRSDLDA